MILILSTILRRIGARKDMPAGLPLWLAIKRTRPAPFRPSLAPLDPASRAQFQRFLTDKCLFPSPNVVHRGCLLSDSVDRLCDASEEPNIVRRTFPETYQCPIE